MNGQNTNGVSGGSNGADFQPPTQNPQSNVNSSLQTTSSGVQTPAENSSSFLLNPNANIVVPTATGSVTIAPTGAPSVTTHPAAKHTPLVAWIGIAIVVVLLAGMAVGLLRPKKY